MSTADILCVFRGDLPHDGSSFAHKFKIKTTPHSFAKNLLSSHLTDQPGRDFPISFSFRSVDRSKLFKIRNEKKLIPDALKRLSKQWQQVVQVTTSLRESLATNLDNTLN